MIGHGIVKRGRTVVHYFHSGCDGTKLTKTTFAHVGALTVGCSTGARSGINERFGQKFVVHVGCESFNGRVQSLGVFGDDLFPDEFLHQVHDPFRTIGTECCNLEFGFGVDIACR